MAAPILKATVVDKLLFIPHIGKVLAALFYRVATYGFVSSKVKKPSKDIIFAALRQHLGTISIAQEQWLMLPSTEDTYLTFARKHKFQPDTTLLDSGLKLHWIGPKTSEKTILFFHGGGYALPCTDGHVQWLFDLQQELSKKTTTSVLLVSYTLAPRAVYPQQLQQAAEALNWLIEKQNTKPSDIIVAGDSAGGNLTLALLSHLLHPHPEVSKVDLQEPLGNAVLISPWVSFSTDEESWKRNAKTDILHPQAIKRWSLMFLGDKKADEYSEPVLAEAGWFSGLDRVVGNIFIWGGGGEVFIDSIEKIGQTLKAANPGVELVVQPDVAHDDFITEIMLRYKKKHDGTKAIERWLTDRI